MHTSIHTSIHTPIHTPIHTSIHTPYINHTLDTGTSVIVRFNEVLAISA